VLKIKILVLQHWQHLSDQWIELEMATNISFMRFLDFQENIPDSTTIWLFKERLKKNKLLDRIWQELQRQLNAKGLMLKKVASRILPSSPPIQIDQAIRIMVKKLKLAGAKMAPGPRRVKNFISDTSFITKWCLDMV
jgi:IS5 family transposase